MNPHMQLARIESFQKSLQAVPAAALQVISFLEKHQKPLLGGVGELVKLEEKLENTLPSQATTTLPTTMHKVEQLKSVHILNHASNTMQVRTQQMGDMIKNAWNNMGISLTDYQFTHQQQMNRVTSMIAVLNQVWNKPVNSSVSTEQVYQFVNQVFKKQLLTRQQQHQSMFNATTMNYFQHLDRIQKHPIQAFASETKQQFIQDQKWYQQFQGLEKHWPQSMSTTLSNSSTTWNTKLIKQMEQVNTQIATNIFQENLRIEQEFLKAYQAKEKLLNTVSSHVQDQKSVFELAKVKKQEQALRWTDAAHHDQLKLPANSAQKNTKTPVQLNIQKLIEQVTIHSNQAESGATALAHTLKEKLVQILQEELAVIN